jgi:hypothetical protein
MEAAITVFSLIAAETAMEKIPHKDADRLNEQMVMITKVLHQ